MEAENSSPRRKVSIKKVKFNKEEFVSFLFNPLIVPRSVETQTPNDSENEEVNNISKKSSTLTRIFCPSWLKIFTFLKYDKVANCLFCEICTKYGTITKWNFNLQHEDKKTKKMVRGIQRFKIDGIKAHALNDKHRDAVSKAFSSKNLIKTISNLFDKARNDYLRIMKAALFITKNHLSCSNFVEVCALLQSYGIKLTEKELYLTKYGYYEMLKTFSEVISKHLIEK